MSDKPPQQPQVKVIKRHDLPLKPRVFTDNDFHRNEINYMRMLMHRNQKWAIEFAAEISLTDNTAKV